LSASVVIFYILATLVLGGALLAVVIRRIFQAAVFLLFSLLGVAGIYFFLDYQFLAAIQIVVYVGGIVVLIIFSIFLTADSGGEMKKPSLARLLFTSFITIIAFVLSFILIRGQHFSASINAAVEPSVRNIGRQMLSTTQYGYILPFEVVSILLLAAMIGCIVIAIKTKPKS
jgi:NADH-quinone oxidoreductase subunit J